MSAKFHSNLKLLLLGAGVGTVYGVLVRLSGNVSDFIEVMSVAFLGAMPFIGGFLAVYLMERQRQQSLWLWFFAPWLTVLGGCAAMSLTWLEGWICVVMYLPVGLVLSTLGGTVGGIIARHVRHKRVTDVGVACLLFLPFLINPLEPALFKRDETRIVENVIDIKVSPKAIWDQIKSVPEIHKNELSPSWSHRIGFPDPISATLSFEGVGGVRRATFAGGLVFVETVDAWEPEQRLSFSIHPQTTGIPATTLDEHVTVGGPYFDVLRGEYRIEPLTNGVTRLHLHSQHRLSTDFNSYARLWTDALMSDLQKTILLVVQRRAEAKERLAHN